MEALVGAIVGAFALYVAYRRLSFVRAFWHRRDQLARFERALRDARANASGPSPWRLARADDRDLVALLLHAAAGDEHALGAAGFVPLGELVGELPAGRATLVLRALVRGPAVAFLMISTTTPTRVRMTISSYGPDQQFSTARDSDGRSLATPPFVHLRHLRADATALEVVREHAAFATAGELRTLATLDELLATMAAHRALVQRWRDAQPPDALLEADLRGLLGPAYDGAGAYWARKLRARLPDARLRRG